MNVRRETGGRQSPTARRFRAVMVATSLPRENATAWSIRMGLGPTQVSNFRNGIPVSKMAANRIADKTGISTDYLMRGDERFLTVEMRERIQKALDAEEPPAEIPEIDLAEIDNLPP